MPTSPGGGKEIRVSDYEVLTRKDQNKTGYRWSELHAPGLVSFETEYQVVGIEGRCNLYALKKTGVLEHTLKDSRTKGVKNSDMSQQGVAKALSRLMSQKPPKVTIAKVTEFKKDQTDYNWGYHPYRWGSFSYQGQDTVRPLYPTGGVIEYRPITAYLRGLASNTEDTFLPDVLRCNFKHVVKEDGSLPRINLIAKVYTTIRFIYQRAAQEKSPSDVPVVKCQLFANYNAPYDTPMLTTVEPAIHLGNGMYMVEIAIPSPETGGSRSVFLTPAYYSPATQSIYAATEELLIKELTFQHYEGGYHLYLKQDPTGSVAESLRTTLNRDMSFRSLYGGIVNTVNKLKILVIDGENIPTKPSVPDNVDGVLIRAKSPVVLAKADAAFPIPAQWRKELAPTSAEAAGKKSLVAEVISSFESIQMSVMDRQIIKSKAEEPKDIDIVQSLAIAGTGAKVYMAERNRIAEQAKGDGTKLVEKSTERVPVESTDTIKGRLSKHTDKAKTTADGFKIGMIAYSTGQSVITAYRSGDRIDAVIYAVQGTVPVANKTISMSKLANKAAYCEGLDYAEAAAGFLWTAKAAYDFSKAGNAWDRQARGQQILSTSFATGLSIVTVAFPPAEVIDPTFKLAVSAFNKWIPGSKSNKELTANALSDIGSAFSFLASYLTTGLSKELAEQALKQAVEDTRKRFPDRVFIVP